VYPGSFIWRRISDEWLVSKAASVCFAVASLIITAITVVSFPDTPIQDIGVISRTLWGIFGALAAVSIFFLWGGMWRYWIDCDPTSRMSRRVWFAILIVGLWYGAILYYVCVFLPTTRKKDRESLGRIVE